MGQEEKAYGQLKNYLSKTYERAKLSYSLVPGEGRLLFGHLTEAAVVPQPHRSFPQTHLYSVLPNLPETMQQCRSRVAVPLQALVP